VHHYMLNDRHIDSWTLENFMSDDNCVRIGLLQYAFNILHLIFLSFELVLQ